MSAGFKHVGSDKTYSLTVYPHSRNPLPVGAVNQYQDLSFDAVVALVAPGVTPRVMKDKVFLPYFTSGLLSYGEVSDGAREMLKEEAGEPVTHGYARCINCCQGPFNLLLYDIDGVTEHAFNEFHGILDEFGVDYLLFSTFSHGSPEKPGYRCRLILPMHPAVNVEQYQLIHNVVQQGLLAPVKLGLDPSSRLPWQQQGFWATKPDLVQHAFKFHRSEGLVLDTDYWLDKARTYQINKGVSHKKVRPIPTKGSGADDCSLKISLCKALSQIPSRTRHFQTILIYTKALEPAIDSYQLFYDWAWSDPEHQAAQEQQRSAYDPAVAWAKARPIMPIQAAVGAIHKLARESSIETIRVDPLLRHKDTEEAAQYLYVHHRKHFSLLRSQLLDMPESTSNDLVVPTREAA